MVPLQDLSKWDSVNRLLAQVGLVLVVAGLIGMVALPMDPPIGGFILLLGWGSLALSILMWVLGRLAGVLRGRHSESD